MKGKIVYAKSDGELGAPGILRVELTSIAGHSVRSDTVAWVGDAGKPTPTRGSGSGHEPTTEGEARVPAGTVVTFAVTGRGGDRYVPKHRLSR